MQNIKKYFMTLALLLTAVGGAWAEETPLLTIESKDYKSFTSGSKTFDDKVTVTFSKTVYNDGNDDGWFGTISTTSLLTVAGTNGYTITSCKFYTKSGTASTGYTIEGESPSVYLSYWTVYTDANQSEGKGTAGVTKIEVYGTAPAAEPTEWLLTPDADKKVWTLAKMPASNIELQVEYYAESNLFLGKEALADKANIAVKNGETAVDFDPDGKSTTTVTEGIPMTVKFNGTKKVLGMKVEKKAAAAYTLLSAATTSDYGKVVCAAGHLHDAKTAVPDGCTAVGILGKVTETGHGLILALKDATNQNCNTINGWTSASYAGTTLKVLPDDAARGANLTSYTSLGETTVSNWAVAQQSDYDAIFTNLGSMTGDSMGKTYDGNVNAFITTGVGGTEISGNYWSPTEDGVIGAWSFNSVFWSRSGKSNSNSVRPVLGF